MFDLTECLCVGTGKSAVDVQAKPVIGAASGRGSGCGGGGGSGCGSCGCGPCGSGDALVIVYEKKRVPSVDIERNVLHRELTVIDDRARRPIRYQKEVRDCARN